MATLSIIHWNDVYKVTPQKVSSTETINVTQFAALLDSIRDKWTLRADGEREGLVMFSGVNLHQCLNSADPKLSDEGRL